MTKHEGATITKVKHRKRLGKAKQELDQCRRDLAVVTLERDIARGDAAEASAGLDQAVRVRAEAEERVDEAALRLLEAQTERDEVRGEVRRLTAAITNIGKVAVAPSRANRASDKVAHGLYKNAYDRMHTFVAQALGKD